MITMINHNLNYITLVIRRNTWNYFILLTNLYK